jgi:hypothetical protein
VSLQVKLAHKLKLTEKQLLHWMLPIMLIMIIFLTTCMACQVSLELKLAHKLKMMEKQLLNWMLPIMLIMIM